MRAGTAVQWGDELTVGAGGTIVLASDPQTEYDEMIPKALAPLRALSVSERAHDLTYDPIA